VQGETIRLTYSTASLQVPSLILLRTPSAVARQPLDESPPLHYRCDTACNNPRRYLYEEASDRAVFATDGRDLGSAWLDQLVGGREPQMESPLVVMGRDTG
jgi:hypothetical protein